MFCAFFGGGVATVCISSIGIFFHIVQGHEPETLHWSNNIKTSGADCLSDRGRDSHKVRTFMDASFHRQKTAAGSRKQKSKCFVCCGCVCVCVCVYVYVCVVCCWKFCCCCFFKWVLFVPTLFVGGCGVVGDAHQPLETFVTLQFTCPVPE